MRRKFQEPKPGATSKKTYLCYQNSLCDDYELVDDEDEPAPDEAEPQEKVTEEWSEIPLNSMTESNSSTSSCSQRFERNEDVDNEASGSNDTESKDDEKKQSGIGFSNWISKSSFRRQSLEDVFAQSTLFGKFGRSRRNSESEVEASTTSVKKDFFLFGRHDGLTDSQIENLFLPPEIL